MSDAVCEHCGKANGWHAFACPNAVLIGTEPTIIQRDEVDEAIVIMKLPEVE